MISLRQLREIGFRDGAVKRRLSSGHLHQIHRGVYAVGHPGVTQRGVWLAAVLAGPIGTVLSHRSAAALWGLLPQQVKPIEITAPSHLRSDDECRIHQCRLVPAEVTQRFSIPATTVPRTLLDLAAVTPHRLVPALYEAEVLGFTDSAKLEACVRLNPGRRGVARLRAALPESAVPVRSELERRFLALIVRESLPRPETGVLIEVGGELLECDCLWREQRLIVELDGRRYHDTTIAFERDRARDRSLQAAGWQVVRVTWNQVRDRDALLADLRHLLVRRTHH